MGKQPPWTFSLAWTWGCSQFCMARFVCLGEISALDLFLGEDRSMWAGETQGSQAQQHRLGWLHPGLGRCEGSQEVKVAVVCGWWGLRGDRNWEVISEGFLFSNTNRPFLGKGVVLSESLEGNWVFLVGGKVGEQVPVCCESLSGGVQGCALRSCGASLTQGTNCCSSFFFFF